MAVKAKSGRARTKSGKARAKTGKAKSKKPIGRLQSSKLHG